MLTSIVAQAKKKSVASEKLGGKRGTEVNETASQPCIGHADHVWRAVVRKSWHATGMQHLQHEMSVTWHHMPMPLGIFWICLLDLSFRNQTARALGVAIKHGWHELCLAVGCGSRLKCSFRPCSPA